jgi:hypothetical protein
LTPQRLLLLTTAPLFATTYVWKGMLVEIGFYAQACVAELCDVLQERMLIS